MKLLLLIPLALLCLCAFAQETIAVPPDQAAKCRAEGGCKLLTMQELSALLAYIRELEKAGQSCRKSRYDI